jgi:hypothetical protein
MMQTGPLVGTEAILVVSCNWYCRSHTLTVSGESNVDVPDLQGSKQCLRYGRNGCPDGDR